MLYVSESHNLILILGFLVLILNGTFINMQVVIPLDQLRAVNSSANPRNPSEKYIQIVTKDNHEFWFMGFISYEKALKNLTECIQFSSYVFQEGNN